MGLASTLAEARLRRARGRAVAILGSLAFSGMIVVAGPRPLLGPARVVAGGEEAGYRYMLVGNPGDVTRPTRGGMALQGGGTDLDEGFRWLIERSGGGDFLVLRTTGTDAYNDYVYGLRTASGLRADSAATLIVGSRAASSDPFVLGAIRSAEALWLAGGDQALHYARWRGTPVADAIHELVARGVPIGGTSSGLALMGEYAYTAEADRPTDPHLTSTMLLRDPHHPRVVIRRDFLRLPRLDGVILEPHFLQESRYGRMAAFLTRIAAQWPGGSPRGIGIDWKTALLVEPDGRARVIGHPENPLGSVTLFRATAPPPAVEPGRPLEVGPIEAAEFGPGATVDLGRWRGEARRSYRLSAGSGVVRADPIEASPGPAS